MLKPIPIELILSAQQLVTAYGTVDHCLSYSGYLNDGTAYINYYAKLPTVAYPRVEIKILDDEITIMVRVIADLGSTSDDYK